jgi:hypothetical protein
VFIYLKIAALTNVFFIQIFLHIYTKTGIEGDILFLIPELISPLTYFNYVYAVVSFLRGYLCVGWLLGGRNQPIMFQWWPILDKKTSAGANSIWGPIYQLRFAFFGQVDEDLRERNRRD